MEIKPDMFKEWEMTKHCAISPDGRFTLWIANGFMSFGDEGKEMLVEHLSAFHRYRVWRALKKEHLRRVYDYFLPEYPREV